MADRPDPDADDGLSRLRERLQATQRAAERLVEGLERGTSPPAGGDVEPGGSPSAPPAAAWGEDAGADRTTSRPPPAGYAEPDPGPTPGTLDELAALVRMVRALVPEELARELGELARELLLLLRALIDWLVGRLEGERDEPVEVTDIPIA